MEKNSEMKLKPFDLEKALKGEKVVTRDGREVFDIAHFPHKTGEFRVYGVLEEIVVTFTEEGSWMGDTKSHEDLFMALKERVVWVNLYIDGSVGNHHSSEDNADSAADGSKRIGNRAYPIHIEED